MLYDTTVFCGAFVRVLQLGMPGLYQPIVSQAVLAEFVRRAVVEGLGRQRRRHAYEDVRRWLDALAPLLEHAEPVGLRNALTQLFSQPAVPLGQAMQHVVGRWPAGVTAGDPPFQFGTSILATGMSSRPSWNTGLTSW